MSSFRLTGGLPLMAGAMAALLVGGCERPPMKTVQMGYRGLGEETIANPRLVYAKFNATEIPAPQPPAVPVPVAAKTSYPDLQVLGDVSITEFNRTMAAIAEWVAPKEQGCSYCHNLANMASDEKYTKVVARAMLRMTRDVNANWTAHVGETGVTCYTCHRGNPVPKYAWTSDPGPLTPSAFVSPHKNLAAPAVGWTSLPFDPNTAYLDKADTPIPVQSASALPKGSNVGIQHAEWTYGLMMRMSDSLGVNCDYCHNTRSLYTYEKPQKIKAWYAIRHVRHINRNYIWPLKDVLPASRLGKLGDPQRVACQTCHQGAYKPLYGAQMRKDYPALMGTPAPAPAPATKAAEHSAPNPGTPTADPKLTEFEGGSKGLM